MYVFLCDLAFVTILTDYKASVLPERVKKKRKQKQNTIQKKTNVWKKERQRCWTPSSLILEGTHTVLFWNLICARAGTLPWRRSDRKVGTGMTRAAAARAECLLLPARYQHQRQSKLFLMSCSRIRSRSRRARVRNRGGKCSQEKLLWQPGQDVQQELTSAEQTKKFAQ